MVLGYVSVPWMWSRGLLWDGGISLLGALRAAAHLIAALGVTRRAAWARRLGLWMGGIGLFGSGAVLLTIAPRVLSDDTSAVTGSPPPLLVLAVPAAMVLVYGLIVVLLLRARDEFVPRIAR